ncbi:hypothetical protein PoB_004494100 [Plakobranchus ocellatus]|uniref:Uncharacterized protein n=1 Tax=Plakobranchus ocellatus TaxID=259542 RepID=A0AAV4BHT1_9GAST|nr:hypothetical protein PoB_004494100 [Plakobranchus ocellatus]
MDDWPINFVKTKISDKRYKDNEDGAVIGQLRLAHWANCCQGKFETTTKDYRHPRQDYIYKYDHKGHEMIVYDVNLNEEYGGYAASHHSVAGVTPDGHCNDVTVRPPYFMFGVHPDYERKAAGIYPYNYFANMNITYFSTVEWLIASPAPSWIPIGPGGVKNIKHDKIDPKKKPPLQRAFDKESLDKRVDVGGRYDGNFFYGSNIV